MYIRNHIQKYLALQIPILELFMDIEDIILSCQGNKLILAFITIVKMGTFWILKTKQHTELKFQWCFYITEVSSSAKVPRLKIDSDLKE